MRKLILRWLLGENFKSYNELFSDCIKLLEYSREVIKENQLLFEKCDRLMEEIERKELGGK